MPSSADNHIEIETSSRAITEKSGSNLAFSFISLPDEKKKAMSSFYAFCRVADDIVDDRTTPLDQRAIRINAWRKEIEACYTGTPSTTLGRELKHLINRWLIPSEPFLEILNGVEMDLHQSRYATFSELEKYCYRVASAVGLVSIEIFEYEDPKAREYAVALGMAFQLTNILRDVGYDLKEYDRIYLPLDELQAYGVTEEDLRSPTHTPARRRLLLLQYHRASHYFHKAARLLPRESRRNFIAAEVMTEIYHSLLEKLRRRDFPIGIRPTRLSKPGKIAALIRAYRRGASINNQFTLPPRHIRVLGAGFAGLSAAMHLSAEGHRVDLHEAKAYIGGRAHSFLDPKLNLILDNGQHILMGCYHSCLEMVDRMGVHDRLDCPDSLAVPYLSPGGRTSVLDAGQWCPPFHMLGALIGFRELMWKDRIAMMWFAAAVRIGARPDPQQTVAQWLEVFRQTPASIRALWEPFCIAALNEPISSASAALFREVLVRSLFGSGRDASIYIANVGLSELFMPELAHMLNACGGSVQTAEGIKSFQFDRHRISGLTTTKGRELSADMIVSALPWKALKALLPSDHPLARSLETIGSAPILALHLLTDVAITDEPFIGLLDAKIDWIFNRSGQLPEGDSRYLYSIVISAAYDLAQTPSKELETLIWQEINDYFPHTRSGNILHNFLYRSQDATFAARPETEPLRPGPATSWENLLLAGDWTRTGLPGTLEGAAWSGQQVASLLR
ncbi:MAG: hydroxysqualene dehydroxylase HpnE [Candidatus Methylacidiphilales bacterium]